MQGHYIVKAVGNASAMLSGADGALVRVAECITTITLFEFKKFIYMYKGWGNGVDVLFCMYNVHKEYPVFQTERHSTF